MGCKPERFKCSKNEIKIQDADNSNSILDSANNKVVDWWYHYVSRGLGKDKSAYRNKDFMLATCKRTPKLSHINKVISS